MTDSKTATERLRELLDERGVDWDAPNSCLSDDFTMFVVSGNFGMLCYEAYERTDGFLELTAAFYDELKPEQAIAATLGDGECEPTEDWHCPCGQDLVSCDTGIGPSGGAIELDPPILFNYCPNCGAKVVGE